jgi:hypothetical protein
METSPKRRKSPFIQADLTKAIKAAQCANFSIGLAEVDREGTIRIFSIAAMPQHKQKREKVEIDL